jgi:hypothetical protein
MKKKIAKKKDKAKIRGKNIKASALDVQKEQGTDHLPPVFSFKHVCNNHYYLTDWRSEELQRLIDTFRTMESLNWSEVIRYKGLGFKIVDPKTFSTDLPEVISPDISIIEFRVSKRARLFGYRDKNIFNIIWFDRNHEVYSMS